MKQFAALLSVAAFVSVTAASDISGNWNVDAAFDDPTVEAGGFDCMFAQIGQQLTGNCSDVALTGEVKGQSVSWQIEVRNPPQTTTFTGTLNAEGTGIDGRFSIGAKGGHFTASKR